jgi:hypothetical protein
MIFHYDTMNLNMNGSKTLKYHMLDKKKIQIYSKDYYKMFMKSSSSRVSLIKDDSRILNTKYKAKLRPVYFQSSTLFAQLNLKAPAPARLS